MDEPAVSLLPLRGLAAHASIAPYGPYRAGDGAQVFIGVQNEREWAALCADVLVRPDLIEDPRFSRNSRGSRTTPSSARCSRRLWRS
jgi:crotonobetainyl-CoA:carnitine CoA-transferase CaiB-like acyl-CoA transferase